MSARPFQVKDRIKVTVRDVMSGKAIRTHTATVRSIKDMSGQGVDDWATLMADADEPYVMSASSVEHTTVIVHLVPDRTRTTWATSTEIELLPVAAPDATTHVLDRIPGEPNSLDFNPGVGFTAMVEDEESGTSWSERPTMWITAAQFRDLGEPQQITVTIVAGAK